MDIEQVLQLVDAVSESGLSEFQMEEEGVKLFLKKDASGKVLVEETPRTEEKRPAAAEAAEQTVVSPLVGTFYTAPAEGAEPFVKVGDQVEKGQTLGIVEAMKLMNEIESEYSGTVTKVLAENGQPVEYGQPLFAIR